MTSAEKILALALRASAEQNTQLLNALESAKAFITNPLDISNNGANGRATYDLRQYNTVVEKILAAISAVKGKP